MQFLKESGTLFATSVDHKHIIKCSGDFYATIHNQDIISEDGDFIGSFTKASHNNYFVISEMGEVLFYVYLT